MCDTIGRLHGTPTPIFEKWGNERLQPGKVSPTFRKNWEKKNAALK